MIILAFLFVTFMPSHYHLYHHEHHHQHDAAALDHGNHHVADLQLLQAEPIDKRISSDVHTIPSTPDKLITKHIELLGLFLVSSIFFLLLLLVDDRRRRSWHHHNAVRCSTTDYASPPLRAPPVI